MQIFRVLALVLMSVMVASCATNRNITPTDCAVALGAAGLGAGALVGNDDGLDSDDSEDRLAGAAIGAAGGALLGYGICALVLPDAPEPAPEPAAEEPQTDPCEGVVVLTGVNFDVDQSNVRPDAASILNDMADKLGRCPKKLIRVEAHTDSTGSDDYNQALSERRAQSVRDYLVGQGVSASVLETEGFGETRPIDSNDTAEGRARNRRVELHPVD